MKQRTGILVLASFMYAILPNLAHAAMGVSVTAPIRQGIDVACNGAAKTKSHLYIFAKNEFEGAKMGPWKLTTALAEEKIENETRFIAGQIGSVRAIGGKITTATLSQVSGTGDGATETEYCYQNDRLARMRTTVDSVTYEMQWIGTTYFIGGQSVGPFVRAKNLARHRTSIPPAPRFEEGVYSTPARLPFYEIFTSISKKDRP